MHREYPEDEILAAYATSRETVQSIRKRFQIGHVALYHIVDKHGMGRRRNGDLQRNDSPSCPGWPHYYCAFCVHAAYCADVAGNDDWHCQSCVAYKDCPCQHADLRRASWEEELAKWQTARDKRHNRGK